MVFGRVEQLAAAVFNIAYELWQAFTAYIGHIDTYTCLPAVTIHKGSHNAVKVVSLTAAVGRGFTTKVLRQKEKRGCRA